MDAGIVELQEVTKRFGGVLAVDNVSLTVRKGEFVSLLGPSGCGKTTLLRIAAGFESPDSGAILLDGADVTAIPPHRRPVNLVFQSYALFPHLNVYDNVAFGLRRKRLGEREISQQVEHFLDLVRLGDLRGRFPAQLSGGQQQRVALARALVNRPKVLLLDEPLAALDRELRRRMQVELKILQRELDISFIFVTHDQEEALALSDRIAVMHRGRVLQFGNVREVYDTPNCEYVARFLGEANILRGEVSHTGAEVVLRVDGRAIRARAPAMGALLNGTALLAVRPEHITVSASALQKDNVFPCVIETKVFSGTAPTIFIKTGEDRMMAVRSVDRATFDALQPGMQGFIGWQAVQGSIVAEGDGDA
jgi:spermidine/putrescine transport system ATP-binding protein